MAASREPILVQDVADAARHPLLRDQYFTTGSFISFPLVYHDELVGVVNLTNRARQGLFLEEDVERVRLLALVIALVATNAALPERLLDAIGDPLTRWRTPSVRLAGGHSLSTEDTAAGVRDDHARRGDARPGRGASRRACA